MPKMAEDSLRSAIDAIRSRLHEELETQLAHIAMRHADEVESARRAAEADGEQRWSARVEEVRHEWTARLESEIAAVRADAERRMGAESTRLRVEAEQAAAERVAAVREELEHALREERARADELAEHRQHIEQTIAEERGRLTHERDEVQRTLEGARHDLQGLQAEFERVRQTLEAATHERDGAVRARQDAFEREQQLTSDLIRERQSRDEDQRRREEQEVAIAEARLAERQSQLAIVERVLNALRAMDASRSLSDVLTSLTSSAASEAPRVALFVVNGSDLRGWRSAGFSGEPSSLRADVTDQGVLGEALRRREPVATSEAEGPAAPAFAELPPGRAAMAVPLLVANQPVAVLYADDAADGTPAAPASWPEAIQILGRHASVTLAHLTAARAVDAMRRSNTPAGGQKTPGGAEDGHSARRYARLLVSEIKLYNEAAVQIGRQKRDLLARLKPEIERARTLYSQRISPAVDSRGALFQQELVQTLADGDASLLGNPA